MDALSRGGLDVYGKYGWLDGCVKKGCLDECAK